MKSLLKSKFFIPLIIFATSVFIKLLILYKAPIYSDEITWMVRGKEFLYSFIHLNFNYFKTAWWTDVSQTEAISIPLSIINGSFHLLFAGVGKFSLKIMPDIIASRLAVALVTSLIPVFIYIFANKFCGIWVGILASTLYIFNPVTISMDSLVMNDSLLSLFSFLSVFTFVSAIKENKNSFWPGIFLGLAFLTKPNGILIGVMWIFTLVFLRSKSILKLILLNLGSFFLTTFILWPSSWSAPGVSVFEYILRQYSLVKTGVPYFYLGEISNNPNWTFYFFQFFTRFTEVTLFGVLLSSIFFIKQFIYKKKIKLPKYFGIFASFFITFAILITISNQKLGIRYAAPLIPYFCIASSWGILKFLEIIPKNIQKFYLIFVVILISVPVFKFFPNYYLYYNNFIGGVVGAQRYDMVGLCSSSKEAFEFLSFKGSAGSVFIAGCPAATNYYSSLEVTHDFMNADYVVVETYHRKQYPTHPLYKFLENKSPIYEVEIQKATIAQVYEFVKSK